MTFETNIQKKSASRRILIAAPGMSFVRADGSFARVVHQDIPVAAPAPKVMTPPPRKPAVVVKLGSRFVSEPLAEVA